MLHPKVTFITPVSAATGMYPLHDVMIWRYPASFGITLMVRNVSYVAGGMRMSGMVGKSARSVPGVTPLTGGAGDGLVA